MFTQRMWRWRRTWRSSAKACVRTYSAATDPLGQTIRIKSLPFKVVGVLAPKGNISRNGR